MVQVPCTRPAWVFVAPKGSLTRVYGLAWVVLESPEGFSIGSDELSALAS